MAQIALNKPSGGQMILAPEDGTSSETITIPSTGVMHPDARFFNEYNTTLQVTLSGNYTSYTWSGHGLPADVWVFADVFLSSTDGDQSDHLNVHIGPAASTANSWGDTHPSSLPPYGVAIVTNLGDNQGVAAGWYGAWNQTMFKTNSSGQIILTITGTNAGSGVYIRVHGYMEVAA